MGKWKDEDIATPDLIEDYLREFEEGITSHSQFQLNEAEKVKIQRALKATRDFCLGLLAGKKKLYMHDLILMAIGFYGGYLSATDSQRGKIAKTNS